MDGSLNELSIYRYQTGLEDLEDAKLMFEHGRYKNALNRAYYAIFHAIKAVIVLDGFDGSKHGRVIAYFNQNYVKTGVFGVEMSVIIKEAYQNREKADYDDESLYVKIDPETLDIEEGYWINLFMDWHMDYDNFEA